MNRPLLAILFSALACCQWPALADEASSGPRPLALVSPADGETVFMPHPHFRWQKETGASIEDRYRIQISRAESFADLLVDESLDVVSRYVCFKPLEPGTYWWRLRREDGAD